MPRNNAPSQVALRVTVDNCLHKPSFAIKQALVTMKPARTLVLVETLPFPTYKGGDLRSWQNINALKQWSEVGVFGFCSNDRRSKSGPPGMALWRTSTDPSLAYPPPPGRVLESYRWPLDPTGHPYDSYYSETAAGELNSIVAEFRPQVVVVEGLYLYRYLELLKHRECRIVLDCHNVETAVHQQRGAITAGADLSARLIRDILPRRTAVTECQAVHTADQLWVCSAEDARLLSALHHPTARIHIIPNGVEIERYGTPDALTAPAVLGPSKHTLLYLGVFSYWPNAAAALYLIRTLFPRVIARVPDCRLLLVGTMPTAAMVDAAQGDPRIVVTGTVSDVRQFLDANSLLVVPLFEGGGTRFKILEAFASKVPVISTFKGAEGLNVKDETHLMFAESAEQFDTAIHRIWSDDSLRIRLISNGWKLVKEHYSWEVAGRRIGQALEELTADR